MAKKTKRINKDAFDWVQNTTPTEKETPTARTLSEEKRIVVVRYKKEDGVITCIQERPAADKSLWSSIPEDEAFTQVTLTKTQLETSLFEIHHSHKISVTGKTAKLISHKE